MGYIFSVAGIELSGLILSLLYVVFNAKLNIFTWLCGFLSSLIYFYVFFQNSLYVSSALSIIYTLLSVYGFLNWKKSEDGTILKVTLLSNRYKLIYFICGLLLSLIIYFILKDKLYYDLLLGDSVIGGFSIVSSILAAKKHPEAWIGWILTNSVAVAVYFSNGLRSTSVLYLIFIILSVYGYLSWMKSLNEEIEYVR